MDLTDGPSARAQSARTVRRTVWRLACTLAGASMANGLAVAIGLVVVAIALYLAGGLAAASAGAVGILVTTLADVPSPKRRKLQQMLPTPLLGAPLFLSIQLAHHDPVQTGAVLVCGAFVSFMGMAWGKRGGPVSVGLIFCMIFSMATPPPASLIVALVRTGWFFAGSVLYLLWSVAANAALNRRYRTQLLAESLISFGNALRIQGHRFEPGANPDALMAQMMGAQVALADMLQNARDVVLESPDRASRQKPIGMLLALLDARDHLIACELDLDHLAEHGGGTAAAPVLARTLAAFARQVDVLASALLLGTHVPTEPALKIALGRLHRTHDDALDASVLQLIDRVGAIGDEIEQLYALQRGERQADLTLVREHWQLFTSPVLWSWKPLLTQTSMRGLGAPTVRQAIRASLAIGAGYLISLHLPWLGHKYWILITITAVMRANLAQTVERRNARVAGTLFGCVLVTVILATQPRPMTILALSALALAISHAFVVRRYVVTSIAATTLGLLLAHLLLEGNAATFAIFERLGDTLLGAGIAWGFSYVLPVWERGQIPTLVLRTVRAQARHAELALKPAVMVTVPDVQWRLARREAYDSLSALVQATRRTLSEPASVRPPLEPLEAVQALSYQLLAHLAAVKSLLRSRRGQLQMDIAGPVLAQYAADVAQTLEGTGRPPLQPDLPGAPEPVDAAPPDLLAADLTPWLVARLRLVLDVARSLRIEADAARRR
jgi:uncharacterized membrane protein YccC